MKTWFAIPLWQRVIVALILGGILGYIWGPGAESIKIVGDVFIDFIKMLIVPLIFFSIVSGVASIGDVGRLGSVGWRAVGMFLLTGQVAVWLGLTLGTIFAPGIGLDTSAIQMGDVPEPGAFDWREMVRTMIPVSPVGVMAQCAGAAADRLFAAGRHRHPAGPARGYGGGRPHRARVRWRRAGFPEDHDPNHGADPVRRVRADGMGGRHAGAGRGGGAGASWWR